MLPVLLAKSMMKNSMCAESNVWPINTSTLFLDYVNALPKNPTSMENTVSTVTEKNTTMLEPAHANTALTAKFSMPLWEDVHDYLELFLNINNYVNK